MKLTTDEAAKLDALTQPKLGFPQSMLPMAASDPQWWHERERRVRAAIRLRDAQRRKAALTTHGPARFSRSSP
ncbi:MAG: hypothetical protein WDM85_01700 [Caulobacteraceae bacterium]